LRRVGERWLRSDVLPLGHVPPAGITVRLELVRETGGRLCPPSIPRQIQTGGEVLMGHVFRSAATPVTASLRG
jgi:hypothetical protein